jgi:hypothetical protein
LHGALVTGAVRLQAAVVIRTTRVPIGTGHRHAASCDAHPGVVGYGATPEEAIAALEEKLPRRPPTSPRASSAEQPSARTPVPATVRAAAIVRNAIASCGRCGEIAGSRGLCARCRADSSENADAMTRAILVGGVDTDRRRH